MERGNWWETRWFLSLLIVGSAIPLLWPATPQLVDVPAHMGRLRVQLDLANSPELQRYFEFQWALVGNLGVDLLVHPLARLVGLEAAVKFIVMLIPPLTVGGLFWIAREVHGKVSPTAFFAVPFVYSYPFNYGFLNYSLSLGLAMSAFALWLFFARKGQYRLRAAVFVPISICLWIAHAFGWGIFGILAYSAEILRQRKIGHSWLASAGKALLRVVPLCFPFVIMVAGHGHVVTGPTDRFFDLLLKSFELVRTLRDRWLIWDSFGVAVGLLLIGAACFDKRLRWSTTLALPAALLTLTFLAMPVRVLGLDYADMRLVPVIFLIALPAICIDDREAGAERSLAWLGAAFAVFRLASNTVSFELANRESQKWLVALEHIPRGAPVLWLTTEYCGARWEMSRHTHLGSFVIVRKNGFSNDQWQAPGAQLLRVTYEEAGAFKEDRSAFIFDQSCLRHMRIPEHRRIENVLQSFPRNAFSYVWAVNVTNFDMRERPGLKPIWRTNDAVLYKVGQTTN